MQSSASIIIGRGHGIEARSTVEKSEREGGGCKKPAIETSHLEWLPSVNQTVLQQAYVLNRVLGHFFRY